MDFIVRELACEDIIADERTMVSRAGQLCFNPSYRRAPTLQVVIRELSALAKPQGAQGCPPRRAVDLLINE